MNDREQDRAAVAMAELKFVNSDARPKVTALHVSVDSIAPIMAWYGAYYAGDRYAVFANGRRLPKDQNGELIAIERGEHIKETRNGE